jgi:hypothetical protein
MSNLIRISKVATKIKQQDGSLRLVAPGEYFPEAEDMKKPDSWSRLVPKDSVAGKYGLKLYELKKQKSIVPKPEVSGSGEVIPDGTATPEEEAPKPETETHEDLKEEVSEVKAPENTKMTPDWSSMTDSELREYAKKNFGEKINGRYGREKLMEEFYALLEAHSEEG